MRTYLEMLTVVKIVIDTKYFVSKFSRKQNLKFGMYWL
jgi:hypothetical protein